MVAADSLLDLLNEEPQLHEDDQTRHGQPAVSEELRKRNKDICHCHVNNSIKVLNLNSQFSN